ncbi:PilN domain-containing protein [Legionella clemsonensis]|uniref:Fimbrial assembly protein (PilN) n=1 Tax=Legionella clemsonensis TaxID=1867846 RepID=A0A222P0U0_9GAMM|nr:PilN domain-containing protein [Legionella clemsonensis]ASQ45464.1 Fimbrial assembly protein (PilN) [Legionella clemsonensis]
MVGINLLPWRKLRELENKRKFKTAIIIGVFAAISLISLMNFFTNDILLEQENKIKILKKEINILNLKVGELSRIKTEINETKTHVLSFINMQNNPAILMHIFDDLSKETPGDVRLVFITFKNKRITIFGQSINHNGINKMTKILSKNKWLVDAKLVEVSKSKNQKKEFNRFKLQANMEIKNGT